eukprot:m51a1_g11053 putative domain-containing protein (636) ;mRNA; f:510327-512882
MGLFGIPLEQLMESQRARFPDLPIPIFIHNAVQYILRHVGVTRLDIDMEGRRLDVNVVCSLLKMFFRRLDRCLLTPQLYTQWVALGNQELSQEQVPVRIRELLGMMPAVNVAILEKLILLLRQVSLNEETNKMSVKNLATLWGPNLLWLGDSCERTSVLVLQGVMDAVPIFRVVSDLIVHYEEVFVKQLTADSAPLASLRRIKITSRFPIASVCACPSPAAGMPASSVWALNTDGVVAVVNPQTCEVMSRFPTGQQRTLALKVVGADVWSSSYTTLSVWDWRGGVRRVPGFCLAVAIVGDTVWTSSDGMLRVWDPRSVRLIREIPECGNIALDIKRKRAHVWTGGTDGVLRLYSAETYCLVSQVAAPHKKIYAFSAHGERVWSAHEDGTICAWNSETLVMERRVSLGSCVFQAKRVGDTLWCGTRNGDIIVTGDIMQTLMRCHSDAISALIPFWNEAGYWSVISGSWDCCVCTWSVREEMLGLKPPKPDGSQVGSRCSSPASSEEEQGAHNVAESLGALLEEKLRGSLPPTVVCPVGTAKRQILPLDEDGASMRVSPTVGISVVLEAATRSTSDNSTEKAALAWFKENGVSTCSDLADLNDTKIEEMRTVCGEKVYKAIFRVMRQQRRQARTVFT